MNKFLIGGFIIIAILFGALIVNNSIFTANHPTRTAYDWDMYRADGNFVKEMMNRK